MADLSHEPGEAAMTARGRMHASERSDAALGPELRLPLALLARYLFFLSRRPISGSNTGYLRRRLAGLKTLSPALLDGTDIPALNEAIRQLRAMNPANSRVLAERILFTLRPLVRTLDQLPPDVVVSSSPPPSSFLAEPRDILLILGPAIGIGDEIVLFPLPSWLKAANPGARVTVCSAYDRLWDQVAAVDEVSSYTGYDTLLHALSGHPPFARYDLVILADFERPNLTSAVFNQASPARYLDLSLGMQSLSAVDNARRWLHRAPPPGPYAANFYDGLDYLARWLGLAPRPADRFSATVRRRAMPPDDGVWIYINPFTSKHEPAAPYWSRLLSRLFDPSPACPIHFILEPGPEAATARFARTVACSAAGAGLPGVSFRVAGDGTSGRSLQDVFLDIERSHAVICADSFVAHVAPHLGCLALVLASPGLENWRVPHGSNFYLSTEIPIEDNIAAMKLVLGCAGIDGLPATGRQSLGSVERSVVEAGGRLAAALDGGEPEAWHAAWQAFVPAYAAAVDCLPGWPSAFTGLLGDYAYPVAFSRLCEPEVPGLEPDLLRHARDRWQQWENTNLYKYLGLVLGPSTGRKSA